MMAKTATKTAPAAARTNSAGKVQAEIRKLLLGERKSPLSYRAIADRVRQKVPGAKTTDRSVASIASTLRKEKGVKLPDRRQHANA
jgi:hypothetical protein